MKYFSYQIRNLKYYNIDQVKVGAILSYVAIGLNNIVGLVYTPYMLKMLGQNEYGLFSLAASIIAYLTILDFGFANAIIRYTSKFNAENKKDEQYEMFGMFFILYCCIGLIAFIIGVLLYANVNYLFHESMDLEDLNKLQIMLLFMTFNIAFTFPMSIWGAIITAYNKFIFQKTINILRIIINPIIMVIFLYLGYKAITMVLILTIFNIMTLCLNAWYCKYKLNIKIRFGRFNHNFLKEITIYSFWIFLGSVVYKIYWSSGQFFLGIYSGAEIVAIYAITVQLTLIYMNFSTAISGVLLPKITAMVTNGCNDKSISELFLMTGRIQYMIMLYILIGFILFGKQFILLWAGEEYKDAYSMTVLLFISIIIPLVQNVGITILQAKNRMKFSSLLYFIIAVCSLAISIPLIKSYGGLGCAIATSIGHFVGYILIMNIYYYKKININIPRFWIEILKISFVPIIFMVVVYNLMINMQYNDIKELIFGIFIFTTIYISLTWFFSMNVKERNFVKKLILLNRKTSIKTISND